jgi:hypothetical protein
MTKGSTDFNGSITLKASSASAANPPKALATQ